jgi:hypothetical protein
MNTINKEKTSKNELLGIEKELREIKVVLMYATIILSVTILGTIIGFLFLLIKFK